MDDALETEPGKPDVRRLTLTIIAFPVVLIAGGLALRALHLGWIGALVFLVVAMAMSVLLIRATQAKARALGCASPAMLRYNRRMIVASMLYMAILFLAIFAFRFWHLRGPLLWAAALATALPVLGMVWAMGRLLIEETDEYLRSRMVNQALFGAGALLAVATVWGFLEQFYLVPHVPAWAAIPVFAIGMGVSHLGRGGRA
jgi:hypothetical protein